jgi:hypothetical protein
VIEARNIRTEDQQFSEQVTIRRFFEDGALLRIDVFDGGWRVGIYKTEAGALRAAEKRSTDA